MLIQFRFKNFRSFRDDTVFSMLASSDDTLIQNTTTTGVLPKNRKGEQQRLLNSAAVYGANASGKSNLIHALSFMRSAVLNSDVLSPQRKINAQYFLLNKESRNQPTEFEIDFIQNEMRYNYGFKIGDGKILEEWLTAYPKGKAQTLFERSIQAEPGWKPKLIQENGTKWFWTNTLKGQKAVMADVILPHVLFLSIAPLLKDVQLIEIQEWFKSNLVIFFAAQQNTGSSNEQPLSVPEFLEKLSKKEPNASKQFSTLLRGADLGITDWRVEEKDFDTSEQLANLPQEIREAIKTFQNAISKFNDEKQIKNIVKTWELELLHSTDFEEAISFPSEMESLGTHRLIERSVPILSALETGTTLIVDELDSSLHPILLRAIVNLFHDLSINTKGAQLIFNTHDVTLMDTSIFDEPLLRRDQIWLVQKDMDGSSKLYSLWDFKQNTPRKNGEAFLKNYLQGRYGAVPIVDTLLEADNFEKSGSYHEALS